MSRQFDVHRLEPLRGGGAPVFVVNLQADTVVAATCIIVPLVRVGERPAIERVSVQVRFDGSVCWLALAEPIAVDRRSLGASLGSLAEHRDAIIRALDLLFTGV